METQNLYWKGVLKGFGGHKFYKYILCSCTGCFSGESPGKSLAHVPLLTTIGLNKFY